MTTSDTTPDIGGPEAGREAGTPVPGDSGRGVLAGLDPQLRRLAVVVVLGSVDGVATVVVVVACAAVNIALMDACNGSFGVTPAGSKASVTRR